MRLFQQRLRRQDVRLRGMPVGFALVEGGLRNIVVAHKLLAALVLQLCIDFGRLCCGKIGLLLVDRRLVGCLLDPEQQIVLFYILPFGEGALLDETRYSRHNVDLVDCGDASDVIACFRDLPADHGGDGNRWRGYRPLRGSQGTLSEQASPGCKRRHRKGMIRTKHGDCSEKTTDDRGQRTNGQQKEIAVL